MKKLFLILLLFPMLAVCQPTKGIDSATIRDGKTLLNWIKGASTVKGVVSSNSSVDADGNLLIGSNPTVSGNSVRNIVNGDGVYVTNTSNGLIQANHTVIINSSGATSLGADHYIKNAPYSNTLGDAGKTFGYVGFNTGYFNTQASDYGTTIGRNLYAGDSTNTALYSDVHLIGSNFSSKNRGLTIGFNKPQFYFNPNGTLSFSNGSSNIGIGDSTLKSITTGMNNGGIGLHVLQHNAGGNDNQGFGWDVLFNNVNGSANFGAVQDALHKNVGGSNNIGIGRGSLYSNLSSDNQGLGYGAGQDHVNGTDNLFHGSYSGQKHTSGYGNSFFGNYSGENSGTSSYSTYLGFAAGGFNSTGSYNLAVGYGTEVTGDHKINIANTIFGTNAGLPTSAIKIENDFEVGGNFILGGFPVHVSGQPFVGAQLTITSQAASGVYQATWQLPQTVAQKQINYTKPETFAAILPDGQLIYLYKVNR